MKFNKSLLTAALLTAGSLTVANAATTDQFDVLLTVDEVCAVVTGATADISLGNIAAGEAQLIPGSVTGSTTITTNCSVGSAAIIALTPVSTSGTTGLGNLIGPNSETVAYKLTSVTGGTGGTAWGNIVGTNTVTTAAAGNYATGIATTVYATVTSTADVTPGAYKDTVNVSVTF
jgi:spore coat protein U-like protein